MRWPGDGKADQRVSGWSPCFPGGGGPSLARSHGGPVHTEGPFTRRARSHGGPVHTEGPFTPRARSHRGPVTEHNAAHHGCHLRVLWPLSRPHFKLLGEEKGKRVLATVKA